MKRVDVQLVVMTVRDDGLEVLLVRRPGNVWSLPGGRASGARTLTAAAEDLLRTETGIRDIWLEQLYTFDRDAGEGVAVAYLALIAAERHPLAPGSEVVEVRWFGLGDLPALSGDDAEVVAYGHRRLRSKTAYAPIAVQLLPETFTLGELQAVYEAVLGQRLDTRNFRRDVLAAGVVQEAGTARRRGPGRPARLYRSAGGDFAVDARERRVSGRVAPPPPPAAG
jgi:8-oxo-dGTP diphosphatase